MVSIIIPSFNHADFLQERLDSIEKQTYKNWVAIIIDDCSTDKSLNILKEFAERNKSKIAHFIVNESNSGSGYFSWQKGINLANTEFIWIAETDDFSEPEFLQKQVELLQNSPKAAFVFCNSYYINDKGKTLYSSEKRTSDLLSNKESHKEIESHLFLEKMPLETYITNGSSVVFRKPNQLIPLAIFNNKQCSDIFLWTFLVQNKTFVFNSSKLNYFRQHQNSTTAKFNAFFLKQVYIENFLYLDYFNQIQKTKLVLTAYIKNYIILNRKEWFQTKYFKDIRVLKSKKQYYYLQLFQQIIKKIFSKYGIK